MTAVLSAEADHETEMEVCVDEVLAKPVGVVGASTSGPAGQALVDTVAPVGPERFPAASAASTANV